VTSDPTHDERRSTEDRPKQNTTQVKKVRYTPRMILGGVNYGILIFGWTNPYQIMGLTCKTLFTQKIKSNQH